MKKLHVTKYMYGAYVKKTRFFFVSLKAKVDLWLQVSYPSSPHPAPPLTCLWMIWVPGLCLMLGTMMMVCPGSLSQLISSGGNSSATSMEVLLQTYSVLDQSQGGNITLNLKRLFKIRVSDHLPLNRKKPRAQNSNQWLETRIFNYDV